MDEEAEQIDLQEKNPRKKKTVKKMVRRKKNKDDGAVKQNNLMAPSAGEADEFDAVGGEPVPNAGF